MKTEVSTDDVDAAVHDFVVSKNAYPSPLGISGWMEFHVSDVEDFQNVLSPGESDLRENTNIELEDTLPKFNMEPKDDGVRKESPLPGCHFQVPC